jgi:general secretion pathway protein G
VWNELDSLRTDARAGFRGDTGAEEEAMIASSCQPASRRNHARAFTLVEILIVVVILGILATIVIPQFSNASQQARESTLKDDLRYLRTQIGVYKAQHEDVAPGISGDFADQLSKYTDVLGNTSPTVDNTFKYGPYLLRMPINPLNGKDTIKLSTAADPTTDVDDTTGWIYNSSLQQIIANQSGADNNGAGTLYSHY